MKPIRIFAIAALLGALAGCAEAAMPHASPARLAAAEVRLDAEEARAMINRYRARRGLKPVQPDARLAQAAQRQAYDLARRDTVAHMGSDGSDPWQRVKAAGFEARLAAENVGAGQRSFTEVLQGWKDSPGHNRNLLLSDATHMGIALATRPNSRYQTFWTLVLGNPVRL